MPDVDFEQFAKILVEKYPDDIKSDGNKVSSDKPCNSFELGNLTLRIGGLYYRIPQLFYAEDTEQGGCYFLFERNDEYLIDNDSIQSEDGTLDKDSNNGYILGLPFVRAYMIYLDFDANYIGFATKENNYGAIITSKREVSAPPTPIVDDYRL